jgi:hypothetical protein
VKVSRLTTERCGGIRWSRRGVDGDCIGEIASREECALECVIVWGACDLDPAQCQLAGRL